MKLEITDNVDDIFYVTTHQDLIGDISDDVSSSLTLDEYKKAIESTLKDYIHIKVLDDNGEIAGLFNCHDENGNLEVHINMLKKYRGIFALEAVGRFKELIFNKTNYTKLVTKIPSKFLNVFKFTSKIGGQLEYMIPEAHIVGGKKYDLYYFSLSKE